MRVGCEGVLRESELRERCKGVVRGSGGEVY